MTAAFNARRQATVTRTRAAARVPVLALVNPAAGGDPRALVQALSGINTIALQAVETAGADEIEQILVEQVTEEPPEVVVAIGGDGTVARIAAALHTIRHRTGAAPALLIAPGGTGNSSFRGLWGHRAWRDVAAGALERGAARIATIDLAFVEEFGTLTLLGSATGLLPATLVAARDMAGSGRDLLRRATIAAAATLQPYPGRVVVDGEPIVAGHFLLTNAGGMRHRGGDFQLLPHSILDDGLIDVSVVTAAVNMADLAEAAFAGTLDNIAGVHYARGRRVRLERTDGEPLLFEHDGELMPCTHTGYELHVVPQALRVLVPDPPPACLRRATPARTFTEITKRGAR